MTMIIDGTTGATFPDATAQTTAYPGTAVLSLNGSTGAVKGATLVNTTTITAATTVDITTGMSNAGWYIIELTGTLSTTASITEFDLRTSSNGGSTFNAGAGEYRLINLIDGSINASTVLGIVAQKGGFNTVYDVQTNILLYTGTASTRPKATSLNGNLGQTLTEGSSFQYFGTRQANEQVNAIRFVRTTGTNTLTGVAYVYYLGI